MSKPTKTAAAPQKENVATTQAATQQQQVAVIQPPRLPYHPALQERFGVDKAAWKVLCESIFPSAKTPDSIVLALSYCKARRLDPYKRNIHIVPIYDAKKREEVETVWPGIAELRTTAMRTKAYAGMESPVFGPIITRKFKDSKKDGNDYQDIETEVSFPEWCRITVNRRVQGDIVSFPGPTVYWLEFYNKKSRYVDAPNEQWRRRPSQMLEKCAEAGALRRAFPEEFGEEYTVEEIGAFGSLATSKAVDAEVISTTSPVEPRRSDFVKADAGEPERQHDAQEEPPPHDEETGEMRDAAAEAQGAAVNETADPWLAQGAGQEAITKNIVELIAKATTLADCDAIDKANGERVKKFTQANRATITVAMENKREDLGRAA